MGNTVSLIADTWEEAFQKMKEQVETDFGEFAQDVILLNPDTEEVKLFRFIIDDEYNFSYKPISMEDEVHGIFGVAMAKLYGKKPGPGQWIAICHFDI